MEISIDNHLIISAPYRVVLYFPQFFLLFAEVELLGVEFCLFVLLFLIQNMLYLRDIQ
jgi:hypothetical protein